MFFKSLTCRTPEIVVVAKEGLRQVCFWPVQTIVLQDVAPAAISATLF
jgi:hypothetical protein